MRMNKNCQNNSFAISNSGWIANSAAGGTIAIGAFGLTEAEIHCSGIVNHPFPESSRSSFSYLACLLDLLLLVVIATSNCSAQLTDQTQAPNTAQAGIAKSLQDEVGAGRGDVYTPDSSLFVINRPFSFGSSRAPALSAQVYSRARPRPE